MLKKPEVELTLNVLIFFSCFSAAFLFLEESHHTKKKRRERKEESEERGRCDQDSVSSGASTLETIDSSGSLQSNDSGIELLSGGKLAKVDSDTELIDVTQPEIDDDDLIMVESDIDTDSDFERVNSDTELLYKVVHRDTKNLKRTQMGSKPSISPRLCVPECLVSQCGPRQCYGSVRNSLLDTYECVAVSLEHLKGCCSCHQRKWTPGGVKGQAAGKLRGCGHSVSSYIRLICDRRVFVSTFIYGFFAFLVVMCNEV